MQEMPDSPYFSLSREELILRAEKGSVELEEVIKELFFQNEEKAKRAAELEIANKELVFQHEEKTKRAAELEIARSYLDNLINYANAPIIVWDQEFRITRFNRAFETLTGRTEAEVLGNSLEILFPPELVESSMDLIRNTVTGAKWEVVEIKIQHRDGKVQTVLWNSATLFDLNDQFPVATIAQGQDITVRKQAEQAIKDLNSNLERLVELRTADLKAALYELESFSYSVSHDLQTPLRSMAGFAELLKEKHDGGLDAESRHYLDMISSSTRNMGRLIDDLLDFSRMVRGEMMTMKVDLQKLAREVIQEAAKELPFGRIIDWRIGKLPVVTGDQEMLRQVLVNLISNALKYSSRVESPVIELGALTEDPEVWTLFVRDNGAGFDMRFVDKLFKLFERLHSTKEFEGTGVGLATIRRIIQRHGGRTWAEGEVNKGATFYFTLERESQ